MPDLRGIIHIHSEVMLGSEGFRRMLATVVVFLREEKVFKNIVFAISMVPKILAHSCAFSRVFLFFRCVFLVFRAILARCFSVSGAKFEVVPQTVPSSSAKHQQ